MLRNQNKSPRHAQGLFPKGLSGLLLVCATVLVGWIVQQSYHLRILEERVSSAGAAMSAEHTEQDYAHPATTPSGSMQQISRRLGILESRVQELSQNTRSAPSTSQLSVLQAELQALRVAIDQDHWVEQALHQGASAVCFIQGEYLFLDPCELLPLRYVTQDNPSEDQADVQLSSLDTKLPHDLMLDWQGKGPPLVVRYSGTGFLVHKNGYIITNKHVTAPWQVASEYETLLEKGYLPRQCQFRAFFPGQPEPFELKVIDSSEQHDVALVQARLDGAHIEPLECETDPNILKAGQTIVVLGYPTGIDMMLARMKKDDLDALICNSNGSFNSMLETMAHRNAIQPIATRGMCGRVGADCIIYDAPTAIGGSGAPVISRHGRVTAINTALLRGFSGTNFGIPITQALPLLEKALTTNKPDNILVAR